MQCPKENGNAAELMIAYVAEALEPATQIALERHITQCADCREMAAQQKAVWDALEDWKPAPISSDFDEKLYQRIAQDEQRGWWRRLTGANWSWAFRPAMPVAAACAALIVAFLIRGPLSEYDSTPQVQPQVSIEQVERALDDVDLLKQLTPSAPVEESAGERI
ncbi:MAG TPA: zf-HC2 domain-containing protein [Bryobacteraceae bacterium]|nr:zf-HC2 domain-containing protein [Bryobacteraceae bacterium]